MAANMTRNVNFLAIPNIVLFNRRCGSVTGALATQGPSNGQWQCELAAYWLATDLRSMGMVLSMCTSPIVFSNHHTMTCLQQWYLVQYAHAVHCVTLRVRYIHLLAWWWSLLVDIIFAWITTCSKVDAGYRPEVNGYGPIHVYIPLLAWWWSHFILLHTWIPTCSKGGHSLEKEDEFIKNTQELQFLDAAVPVEPFNMEERVKTIHERRRRQTCPSEDNIRYVLFIVDTYIWKHWKATLHKG